MKELLKVLIFQSFILTIFLSCSSKKNCDRIEFPNNFYFVFKDSAYINKYPLDSIKINLIDKTSGKDSVQRPKITDKSSSNFNHVFGLDNLIDSKTKIVISIADTSFIFSDFEIKNVEIETLFLGSYEACIIESFRINGTKRSDFQIMTGL